MSLVVAPSLDVTAADGAVAVLQPPTSLAFSIQQSLVREYDFARSQYRQSHAQYSARVQATGPSRFDQYCANAPHDLHFYTSATDPAACCELAMCTHGPHKAGLHELNHHLRRRARDRLRGAPAKRTFTPADVFALLVQQEAAELSDLLELEAAGFRKVAQAYYDTVYGPSNRLFQAEAQSRRQIEDERSESAKALVSQIREETWAAEQRLMLRVYGMCPELLPHQAQLRAAAEAEAARAVPLVLDSVDAVPLWRRACVIRGETESEEDIEFRRMIFACVVEAHAIEAGYLRHDAAAGTLCRTELPVPVYMRDAIEYALHFEQFALVLREETARMALMDAAAAVWSTPSAQ